LRCACPGRSSMERCCACNGRLGLIRYRLRQESFCSKRCRDKYGAEEELRASRIKAWAEFLAQKSETRQGLPQVNATMGQVLKFRCNDVFFPEVTASMGEAYDAAIASLPPDARSVFYFRERIAKRIMKAAYAGEIDRERLRQSGLSGFRRLTKSSEVPVCPLPNQTF
jgi:hypothetical protein